MTRQVTFERIGRTHNVDPLDIADYLGPDDIANAVHKYARRYLASRDVQVIVSDDDRVTIYAGMHVGGTGQIVDGAA